MTNIKLFVHKIKLVFATSLAAFVFTPVQAQTSQPITLAQSSSSAFTLPPPPNGIGQPGTRTSAAGRRTSCEDTEKPEKPLTALVPIDQNSQLVGGLTTAERPTFWFYVPYRKPLPGKFVLNTEGDSKTIYETHFNLPGKPGVVSLSLPSGKALEIGKNYHWAFQIYCKPGQPPAFVEGGIKRNPLNPAIKSQLEKATPPQLFALYAAQNDWYQALTAAAKLRSTDPKDTNWPNLLHLVGLDDLTSEPIVLEK